MTKTRSSPPRPVRLDWPGKREPEPVEAGLTQTDLVLPRDSAWEATAEGGRLVLGDNLTAMWTLLPQLENRIDLIYADPPFLSGKAYSARIGRGEDSRKPAEWLLDEGYADHWPDGADYLDMLYPRLKLMHRLLAETGTLYLHLDWHASAYARLLLDEIFGRERLVNEIAWVYHGPSPVRRAFNRKHDTLLVYTKSAAYNFNADAVRQPYNEATVRTFASSARAGFGKVPNLARGKVPEDWWYFPVVARLHSERTGYPTQKPEALLERIIRASSNEGDLVADFFCGSGTALVVAERLNRRWLGGDAGARAIHTTRKRLITAGARPFIIEQATLTGTANLPEGEARPLLKVERVMEAGEPVIRLCDYQAARPRPAGMTSFAEVVDYWEVGFGAAGEVFKSEWQTFRRNGKGTLDLAYPIQSKEPGGPVRVRAVDIFGDVAEAVVEISP